MTFAYKIVPAEARAVPCYVVLERAKNAVSLDLFFDEFKIACGISNGSAQEVQAARWKLFTSSHHPPIGRETLYLPFHEVFADWLRSQHNALVGTERDWESLRAAGRATEFIFPYV